MGRDVRSHTDRNALAAVDQQVREAAGQDVGFLLGFIKVGIPVDGLLLDIRQHLAGHLGHTGLGVTVSSRGIAVNGTEVALAIDQRVAQAEILCQTDHSIIDRRIAVGVVRAKHRTDGIGGFAVGVLRVVAALVHRVQDAAVDGFQAVAHIGQSARHDNGHRVVQECRLDFLFHIAHNDLSTGPRHHDDVFFHCITLTQSYLNLLILLHRRGRACPALNFALLPTNGSLLVRCAMRVGYIHPNPISTDFPEYIF